MRRGALPKSPAKLAWRRRLQWATRHPKPRGLLCEWIWDGAIGPVREVQQLVEPSFLAARNRTAEGD